MNEDSYLTDRLVVSDGVIGVKCASIVFYLIHIVYVGPIVLYDMCYCKCSRGIVFLSACLSSCIDSVTEMILTSYETAI